MVTINLFTYTTNPQHVNSLTVLLTGTKWSRETCTPPVISTVAKRNGENRSRYVGILQLRSE